MRQLVFLLGAIAAFAAQVPGASAETLIWGFRAEQLEYRIGDTSDVFAWEFDLTGGTDELKVVWRSEAEYEFESDAFADLENQLRLQTPISDFFDAVAGIRYDTPAGPNRIYGVLGIHGLAPQWFEVDADLFISDKPMFRFEADYEALLTNRVILTPNIEFDLPFADDEAIGVGAWGPKLEVGARLSYDLVDRTIAPYIGVHYERLFGRSADFARDDEEDVDGLFFVVGTRIMF